MVDRANICIDCNQGEQKTQLLQFNYRQSQNRIHTQHLSTLIQEAAELENRHPRFEQPNPSEGHA